ncbi:bifunctional phosphoribosylaminoimidazolecarboxamide formyltransferase/IMP cyclohydrolase [Rubrobacter aplysinae]|uniref:bifunctional phosphoribosylaminoimidazolecarboxamide formyltransferase/IMP cyclohydrolase n=1 Tax=Rubrobacter aplysinae TaxID=909625 RepID=UPI00064BE743
MRRRALVSVADKTGVVEFCRRLSEMGFEIISTGGTARELSEAGMGVTPVEQVTGSPEILGGRVKTLHPRIHGGILADLESPDQVTELVSHDIAPVDLVCVNLYRFEQAVAAPGVEEKEAIENIDVGGPTMLRAAAKNFRSVTVVPGPDHYDEVLSELSSEGHVSEESRRALALAAFRRTAEYDASISGWLASGERNDGDGNNGNGGDGETYAFPERRTVEQERFMPLRYGENPHQDAAYYADAGGEHLLSGVERLGERELSFNNLYDVDAARSVLADLTEWEPDGAAAVIVKHANPCGAAVAAGVSEAYQWAFDGDPVSAFGGIVALSQGVDADLAEGISRVFTEVLVAPEFSPAALEVFEAKPNMILLQAGPLRSPRLSAKPVTGGLLVQEGDRIEDGSDYRAVAGEPSEAQMRDLNFAWRVARGVKSNAIVLASGGATVGIGAGQPSRVDSSKIATRKAGDAARGAVAASDAFFPFADGVEQLADAGVTAVIQPGGSKRDEEVISAAAERGIAMVFTGRRHFLH